MPGLTYSQFVTQIALLAVTQEDNAGFVQLLPMMIQYAELRIARDTTPMNYSVSISGNLYKLSAGNRNLSFPQNLTGTSNDGTSLGGASFVSAEQINLILPSGDTNPNASTRFPLLATTKEFLDAVYGSSVTANRQQPLYFVPFNETYLLVGPVPDVNYFVEIVGTIRPAPLSSTNPLTFLSQYMPDLMVMASMIYLSGFQRNYGRQSDDPQMAQSYEGQYQLLLKSVIPEEARKIFEGSGWSSMPASPTATQDRV